MLHPAEPGDPLLYRRLRRLGRLTVAERLQALCDPGSFEESEPDVRELDGTPALGVRCGFARVHGVEVAVYAHDPALRRGALGAGSAGKVARLLTEAGRRGTPVLALHHCDGVRVEEGIRAVQGWEALLGGHVRLQGVVPQLAAVLGTGVGASAYAVALCDLVVMVRERSFLFVVGPRGVKQATGQDVGMDDLGGADVHARSTGIAHALVDDDKSAIARLRAWVRVFSGPAASSAASSSIAGLIPSDFRRPYDVRPVLDALGDAPLVILDDAFLDGQAFQDAHLVADTGDQQLAVDLIGLPGADGLAIEGGLGVAADEDQQATEGLCAQLAGGLHQQQRLSGGVFPADHDIGVGEGAVEGLLPAVGPPEDAVDRQGAALLEHQIQQDDFILGAIKREDRLFLAFDQTHIPALALHVAFPQPTQIRVAFNNQNIHHTNRAPFLSVFLCLSPFLVICLIR